MDASHLIRDARAAVGISQAQLARRANTSQAAVSAYESGKRKPTSATLARLLEATGRSSLAAGRGTATPGERLRNARNQVLAILGRYRLENPAVFGSIARGEDTAESDVDLLVDMAAGSTILEVGAAADALTELLGVDVDVVPREMLRGSLRSAILADAVPV